jgi:acyl-CoA thioester hydrolase
MSSGPNGFQRYLRRSVPFHHLDPLGIVWHGRYLEYVDEARLELFNRCGIDLYTLAGNNGGCVYPVVRTVTKHVAPLRLAEQFEVYARVLAAKYKIVLGFQIRKTPGGELCFRAESEQVALRLPDWTLEYHIPAPVAQALLAGQGSS